MRPLQTQTRHGCQGILMGCQLEGAQQDTIWATSTVCIARRCHWYINIGSTCFMIGSRFNEDMHLHSSQMTAVGFEPTPLRTGAWSQRLRPLGQTVILKSSKCYHQCFCYFFWPPLLSPLRREHCMFTSTSDCKCNYLCLNFYSTTLYLCLIGFSTLLCKDRAFHQNPPVDYFGRMARDT